MITQNKIFKFTKPFKAIKFRCDGREMKKMIGKDWDVVSSGPVMAGDLAYSRAICKTEKAGFDCVSEVSILSDATFMVCVLRKKQNNA